MIWTGYLAGGSMNILSIFENTDVSLALLSGGIISHANSGSIVYATDEK